MRRLGPARPEALKRRGALRSGLPPARLPAERQARILRDANMKTAAALGVTFPQVVLLRADALSE